MSADTALLLRYVVEPAHTLLLPELSGRQDGLWRSTCFELFVKASSGGYREFNFAPYFAWNAYAFTGWRSNMTIVDVTCEPHLVDARLDDRSHLLRDRYELDVVLGINDVLGSGSKMSLTAVLEEKDGTKSYWALEHPPGEPNFHHPDCFVLELPAAKPA